MPLLSEHRGRDYPFTRSANDRAGPRPGGEFTVLYLGTEPATLPAIFPAQYRYGGFAIGYNLSTAVFGGTAPLVISYLVAVTGNDYMPAFYLIAAALVSIGPILSIPETARASIAGTERPGTS